MEVVRRPYSVWLAQAIFALFVAMFLKLALPDLFGAGGHSFDLKSVIAPAIGIALIAAIVAAMFFLHQGRPFTRWLGALMIIAFAVFSAVGTDSAYYASAAERLGAVFGRRILMPLLCIWWLYAFAFSGKAKRYFSGQRVAVRADASDA